MKKYILIGLMFVFGLSLILEAQNLPSKKKEAIEQTMYNMDYAKALQDVNTELINYPEDYDLNLFRAICFASIKEHNQEAIAAYEIAITKAKTDCQKNEARYYLAKYYCEIGNKVKSLEIANTILNGKGEIDDCSLEMIEKLMKSSCMSKCDDTELQNQIAKIKKDAQEKDSLNNKKINDLNNKITDLENRSKNDSAPSRMTTNREETKVIKKIADPSQPISVDEYYKLHFAFDESDLDKESKDILDRFVIFLNINTDVKANCIGHADMRGTYEVNQTISRERAMKSKAYLVSKGISEDRILISYIGYDEPEIMDQYLVKSHPEFNVGDELTNDFINNLSDEKRIKANHLNRRVELNATK
ncbi:MAG: OmpA family protein [Bacteroidales bacterium]|jgi:outer membrane protein OmpA-like peptidoglycan-associated protein